jgi:putative DNA primase/helicase
MGTIKAVRKYENPIEFTETHKLWIDTNRKPEIWDPDDEAIFNRLHPIPFQVQIPKEEIDKELATKLLAEAEGILAWAVAGAKLWYESGLNKPGAVKAANRRMALRDGPTRPVSPQVLCPGRGIDCTIFSAVSRVPTLV